MEGPPSSSGAAASPQSRHQVAARLIARPLATRDLPTSTRMHREYLPNGLFPALGPTFLQAWHTTFLNSDKAAGTVIEDPVEGRIAGYLLLAVDPRGHAEEVLAHHRGTLMRHGLFGLVRNPRLATYFVRTRGLRYWKRITNSLRRASANEADASAKQASTPNDPAEEQLSVVHAVITDPAYRGMGVAQRLLDWAGEESLAAGATGIALVTDIGVEPGTRSPLVAEDGSGQGAAGLYDRLGWRRHATRTRDGRVLQEFRIDLPMSKRSESAKDAGAAADSPSPPNDSADFPHRHV